MKDLPWFRFYKGAIDDEKLLLLAKEDRWDFVALLCCKAKGILDSDADPSMIRRKAAIKLGVTLVELEQIARRLEDVGLIDAATLQPLAWDRRQFASDSSVERVRRHRAKRAEQGLPQQNAIPAQLRAAVLDKDGHTCIYCGATEDLTMDHKTPQSRGGGDEIDNLVTACRACNASKRDLTHEEFVTRKKSGVTVTRQKQKTDTEEDTEAEGEKKTAADDAFEHAWALYPRRPNNNKVSARKAWAARINAGVEAEVMIDGVRRYAKCCADSGTEPQFIKQAATFFGPDAHYMLDWVATQRQPAGATSARAQHRNSWMTGTNGGRDEPLGDYINA